jgi:hypothetical protein
MVSLIGAVVRPGPENRDQSRVDGMHIRRHPAREARD